MNGVTDVFKLLLAVILMICMVVITPFVLVMKWITKGLQTAFDWCVGKDEE